MISSNEIKTWREIGFLDCDHCGDDWGWSFTDVTLEPGWVFDGDTVICGNCGLRGWVSCSSEDDVVINWHDEPSCWCWWCLEHMTVDCVCPCYP